MCILKLLKNRWIQQAALVGSIGLLVSCGGGDGVALNSEDKSSQDAVVANAPAASNQATTSAETTQHASRIFRPTTPIPADAYRKGMWSPVTNWPLIPIHAVLMPDGRVLTYGTDAAGQQTGRFIYDIWDPAGGLDGGHLTLPNTTETDTFCSSQTLLPDGSGVFISGGDNWTDTGTTNTGNNNTNLLSYTNNTLTRGANLNLPRWYASSITLLNGETYVQGGAGGINFPEVRQANGTLRALLGADTKDFSYAYPRNFVAPNGRVFGYDGEGKMYYVDPTGNGAVTKVGQFDTSYAGGDSSTAMFRPGLILQFGGNSNGAVVIDVRGGNPLIKPTQSMSSQRRLVNGTLLADGQVLATGGSSVWNELVDVNNSAEIWNPATGTWTVGASGVQARLYHSNALLMPDGAVLVGGGGAPGPQTNLNVELYYPPYLFTATGKLAPRPMIEAAPTVLNIGASFNMRVSGAKRVTRVVMVRNGSTTHSFNMGQRFVELAYSSHGNQLLVNAPSRAADAPPGFYMLFALDAAGVPSEAKMVRVNVASTFQYLRRL
jgi:hypothetical protein